MRTRDLRVLNVATDDVASAVETFRKSFGFAVAREGADRAALRVGPAELEFRKEEGAQGLHSIVLEVESLSVAERELREKGHDPKRVELDGRSALAVGPGGTHGARIFLVEA